MNRINNPIVDKTSNPDKTVSDLPKKAPKRFAYPVTAYVEVNNIRQVIQIQNISKTGIQFFSNVSIPHQKQIRLTWEDSKIGAMESTLLVVRNIEQHDESKFQYCYGSKFVNLKDEVRKNVHRVVETTGEHERKSYQKWLDNVPFKTVNDVIIHGRSFLRDILQGSKSSGLIDQFARELKKYERQSFDKNDEISQWLQKIVTQYFHCRILLTVLSNLVRMADVHKLITDKIQSMDCLVKECQKFMESNMITKKTSRELHESLNRLIYGRLELLETFNKHTSMPLPSRHS